MSSEKENLCHVTGDGDESPKSAHTEVITKGDVWRLGCLVIWQVFNMVHMAVILIDWKGWSQETRSSKMWLIGGTFQTIVTVITVVACYRVWLRTLKNK
ncbi:hypothetical protein EDB81DRAFT_2996 [Dactylonectria macrodidyma]|uniref:Uncharacterized protein n=1 Tax=Dactylonectria macrodidyma TaxID=307937 RepID=A0A9P9FQN6_9HYPO|nr:hypothetical protein EDB81DRAFT_2996 [Dactylonectria macrodidyma]